MNFLFDNPLANLSGPAFLWLYGATIAFSIFLFQIFKSQIDQTTSIPLLPIPNNPDVYEIAFLRGGANELVRTTIFALVQKGFLQILINESDKLVWIQQTDINRAGKSLTYLEQKVYDWFGEPRQIKEIFASNAIPEIIQPFAATYISRLEQNNLLTSAELQARAQKIKWFIFLGVIALGGYKLIAALEHGRTNVGFLILLGVGASIIFASIRGLPRLTKHGKNYLERLQFAFERFKWQIPKKGLANASANSANYNNQANAFDPALLAVGLYGVSALSGTIYDQYNQAFYKANQSITTTSSSSCGSGCGSSWDSSSSSSCSSSGGGSSCGGGSCGGGCGGCS